MLAFGVEYGFENAFENDFENAFENDCGWFVSRKVAFCKPGLD